MFHIFLLFEELISEFVFLGKGTWGTRRGVRGEGERSLFALVFKNQNPKEKQEWFWDRQRYIWRLFHKPHGRKRAGVLLREIKLWLEMESWAFFPPNLWVRISERWPDSGETLRRLSEKLCFPIPGLEPKWGGKTPEIWGTWERGRVLPIFHSRVLVRWQEGRAKEPKT